jgi:hypothetical protein
MVSYGGAPPTIRSIAAGAPVAAVNTIAAAVLIIFDVHAKFRADIEVATTAAGAAVAASYRLLRGGGGFGCGLPKLFSKANEAHYGGVRSTLPFDITGPVGSPVIDPPGGSRLTANRLPGGGSCAALITAVLPDCGRNRPSAWGAPPAMPHSSKE